MLKKMVLGLMISKATENQSIVTSGGQ